MDYKKFFKGKKITVMGLGLLGRGLGYTKFLAECGAILTVTDLKPKAELATSLKELKKFRNINFVLGKHRLEDFKNKDMIIKAAGVPLDSVYIKEARKHKIPVEMDVSLFARLAPDVTLVGVTGTRGKSMTTELIYEILKANEKFLDRKVFLGGNVRGVATLPLLKKAKPGDILVAELDSWQLQGFGEARISPHIAVFTSFMPDHMNYYKDNMKKYFADKANIFKYQTKKDILIIRPGMKKFIKKSDVKGKFLVANPKSVDDYKFNVVGEHQKENLACAVLAAKQFKIPEAKIRAAVAKFKGLEGRLQYVKTVKGVKIYNDNNATTPAATIAGLEALNKKKKTILICGGNDKNLDLKNFVKALDKYCKLVVTIPGTGTDRLFDTKFKCPLMGTKNLKEALSVALGEAKTGDVILFSPAFSSFAQFNNEYERGDLFMKIIKKLK
ncbi:MAG TPA: UDP-N-acetylmuramoyl-L-alanine--D-glutamate ligase [Candidatus Paceibacterota bacterium]|nr:UDP-N-acetylmuramoyl-L-alanine--D-glutamate ligase [Candidatus Paceibacterota bacterium]